MCFWLYTDGIRKCNLSNMVFKVWKNEMDNGMHYMCAFDPYSMGFVYVNSPDDIWIAALAQGATNLIAGLIGCLMIYSHGWVGKLTFSIKEIKECLYNGWHVFASTSAISLYTTSTVVILGFLSGTTAVGYFNAANTIRNAVQGLLNPITQAIYPRINYLYDNDYPKCISLIRKSLNGIGCLSF